MRRYPSLTLALILLAVAPSVDAASSRFKVGQKVSVAGALDSKSTPYRIVLNRGRKSQEMFFLNGVTSEQLLQLENTNVVVEGKVSEFPNQFMIEVEKIRSATAEETEKAVLKK